MATLGAWPLVADRARPLGRRVGAALWDPYACVLSLGAEWASAAEPGRWPLPPYHLISASVWGRRHPFVPLAALCERARAGGGGGAGRGPGGLTPPPAPRAGLEHKCWDSHGPACSSAGGPGTRGPGDAADTEGFVDKVTPALPL